MSWKVETNDLKAKDGFASIVFLAEDKENYHTLDIGPNIC